MYKLFRFMCFALAFALVAGALFFPQTAFATEDVSPDETEAVSEPADYEADPEAVPGEESEDGVSGIPADYETGHITPDGTATVINNVFIEGNGLEFFTFATDAGNVFYLIIDRLRERDNVYFLNAVTEADLLALAEIENTGTTAGGTSVSGIPATPGGATPEDPQGEQPEEPEQPPARSGGIGSGTLIFILIGMGVVGGAGYYFKIVKPRQRLAEDDGMDFDDDDDDDYADNDEPDEDYGIGDEGDADGEDERD